MTEQSITTERIEELIEQHEKAITQLEAVKSFYGSAQSYAEVAEYLDELFSGISPRKNHQKEKQDFYIQCGNRVYHNYFNKWLLNKSDSFKSEMDVF